jgi:divalent metal cation (Fe/Co/Zn/Cd) transporter
MLASRNAGGKRRTDPGEEAGSLWSSMASESRRLGVLALIASGILAAVKFIAAGISGSSAMLAAGFHSVADTANQVMLLRRSAVSRWASDAWPHEVLVDVDLNLDPGLSGEDIDGVIGRIDGAIGEAIPEATQVFIEPEFVS